MMPKPIALSTVIKSLIIGLYLKDYQVGFTNLIRNSNQRTLLTVH